MSDAKSKSTSKKPAAEKPVKAANAKKAKSAADSSAASSSMASSSMADSIMQSVQTKEVTMHSSRYFSVLGVGVILAVMSTVFGTAILLSILFDDIQLGRELALDQFIDDGRSKFVGSFPWPLLILTAIAAFISIKLSKKVFMLYRRRMLVLLPVVLGAVIGLSVLATATGAHTEIANNTPLKPLSSFRSLASDNVVSGTITAIDEEQKILIIETPEEKLVKIYYDEKTKYPRQVLREILRGEDGPAEDGVDTVSEWRESRGVGDSFEAGMTIGVFGEYREETEDEFEAQGLREGPGPRVKGIFLKPRSAELNDFEIIFYLQS